MEDQRRTHTARRRAHENNLKLAADEQALVDEEVRCCADEGKGLRGCQGFRQPGFVACEVEREAEKEALVGEEMRDLHHSHIHYHMRAQCSRRLLTARG